MIVDEGRCFSVFFAIIYPLNMDGNIILSTIHHAAATVQNIIEQYNRCKERFLTINLFIFCVRIKPQD